MAVSLGYKGKVTWETIQNPYVPKGMIEAEQMQREYQNGQLAWARLAESFQNTMQFPSTKLQEPRDPEGQS